MSDRARPVAHVVPGGPLLVAGAVPLTRLERIDGAWRLSPPLETGATYALCRCGGSTRLPLCDREAPYRCFEEGAPSGVVPKPFTWELPDAASPAIALKPDGPIRLAGGVPVRGASGALIDRGLRVSLCRCGASGCQPVCDGSHKVVGYREPR